MATLAQVIAALNSFVAAAGLASISKVSLDTVLNEIEVKLSAQIDLDKVSQILQTYANYQTLTEGEGWHVTRVTHQATQPITGYILRFFFEGVLQ